MPVMLFLPSEDSGLQRTVKVLLRFPSVGAFHCKAIDDVVEVLLSFLTGSGTKTKS